LTPQPLIIRDNQALFSHYQQLKRGDIICNRVRMKHGEEFLLTDLLERGVTLIPSATSQLASRSKALQARLLSDLMIPGTSVVYTLHDLLETICLYQRRRITRVVVKDDRKNGGLGIYLFRDIEDVYTQAANNTLSFPFVLQPFMAKARDIRVILTGDHEEAYCRSNPDNFRNNLHWGGTSSVYHLDEDQKTTCSKAMTRAKFPYAHIDLMITRENETYLTEINLNGGIRGAAIPAHELKKKKREVEETLLDRLLNSSTIS